MAKFPNVLAYGARESLRSNRIDVPGQEGIIMAEAVANAATTVATLITQKQQRDNALEFALAKDELIKADIEEREKLKDRKDHDAFDVDYTEAYQKRSDEIIGRRKLTGGDRALASAESDLIRERGRVYAGDLARGIYHEEVVGDVTEALIAGLEEIALAPPELQNEIMENKLQLINGAVEVGALTDDQGVKAIQGFVSAAAKQSLDDMDAEIRLVELQLSRKHRKAEGPITREEIFNDEGSGSIGDFLTLGELNDMIEQTEKEIEIDNTQSLAWEANDAAWEMFKDVGQIKERQDFIRDYPGMTPDARKEAQILDTQQRERMGTDEALQRGDTARELLNGLYASDGGMLDAGKLSTLSRVEQESLRQIRKNLLEGRQWATSTDWEARELWEDMTPAQQAATDFDGFMFADQSKPSGDNIPWKAVVSEDYAERMLEDRRKARLGIAGGSGEYTGLNQEQVLERALVQTPFFDRKPGNTNSDKAKRERWARISDNFNRELIAADRAGVDVTPEKRLEIIGNVLRHEVFTTEGAPDRRRLFAGLDPDRYDDAYIPIDETVFLAGREMTIMEATQVPRRYGGTGEKQVVYDWIKLTMKSFDINGEEPSTRDIEEAWFYLVTQGWDAAYQRMSGVEGY